MSGRTLIRSGKWFQFYRSDEPTSTLAVVLSSRASRPPNFTFWKKFQAIPCNVIYLNSDIAEWYRVGVPGIDGGLRGLGRAVEAFAEQTSSTRIVAVGSSMGAYGAVLLGHFASIDETLVFGLEPLLGIPGGRTEETRNRYMATYPDLRHVRWGKTTVVYGEMDINDVLGAAMIHDKRKAELVCIPFAQHDTPEFLDRAGVLDGMFERLVAGDSFRPEVTPARNPHTDAQLIAALWEANEGHATDDWAALKRATSRHKRLAEASFTGRYLSALATYKLGRIDAAVAELNGITSDIPLFWEGWLLHSAALNKKGEVDRAIQSALNALRLQPTRSIAHFQIASFYERAKNRQKAFEHALWALKLNNESAAYRAKVSTLAEAIGETVNVPTGPQTESYRTASKETLALYGDFGHFWNSFETPPIRLATHPTEGIA